MKLSKQTSDAIQILTQCARGDAELLKVADVAAELGLSKQMALKLAYMLSQAGFLEAVRGPRGGIRLSDRAQSATLGDIVRVLELQPAARSRGDRSGDVFNAYIDEAFDAFLAVLNQHTLADLARRPRRAAKRKSTSKPTRRRSKAVGMATTPARKGVARRPASP